jgi:hypothetical protein
MGHASTRMYCAFHCCLMLSLQFYGSLNLCFTALNKGGGPSAEVGRCLLVESRTACRIKMQPIATHPKRAQQNRCFCYVSKKKMV